MNTELTIGAINPGYGGLPIGVAAALGGATLDWYAHPAQTQDYAGRTIMRYHHPRAGEPADPFGPPPMVDVLTINGYSDFFTTGRFLIDIGYKPSLIVVEVSATRVKARPICKYLNVRGYRAAWRVVRAYDVGAPHVRHRVYVTAVRKDCDAPAVNTAYLDADRCAHPLWPTPSAYDTKLDVHAYRWMHADMDDKAETSALEHWESVTGERYPYPMDIQHSRDDAFRINMAFVEWMMGLPVGYVGHPDIDLDRDERMGLLYSGTVPLQAAHAVAVGLTQMGDQ